MPVLALLSHGKVVSLSCFCCCFQQQTRSDSHSHSFTHIATRRGKEGNRFCELPSFPPFPSTETVISDKCWSCILSGRDCCCLKSQERQKNGQKRIRFPLFLRGYYLFEPVFLRRDARKECRSEGVPPLVRAALTR